MKIARGYDDWLMSPTVTIGIGRLELYCWRSRFTFGLLWAARIAWCAGFACQWRRR